MGRIDGKMRFEAKAVVAIATHIMTPTQFFPVTTPQGLQFLTDLDCWMHASYARIMLRPFPQAVPCAPPLTSLTEASRVLQEIEDLGRHREDTPPTVRRPRVDRFRRNG